MPDLLSLDLDDFTVVVDDSDDNDLLVGPASAVAGRLPDFDPLDEAEEAQSPSWWRLILQEGVRGALKAGLKAYIEAKQPRWPAGTPGGKGGEFMETGQRFLYKGEEFEIKHVVKGKLYAQESSGKYANAKLIELTPDKDASGGLRVKDVTPAPPHKIEGGPSSTEITVVDPYVYPETHDAAIPIPAGSKVTAAEWLLFGEVDQRVYADLMERFGAWKATAAQDKITAVYSGYSTEIQELVKSAYHSQYGSSTGGTLSLTSIFNYGDVAAQTAKYEQARALMSELGEVLQWDLYNRVRAPDVAIFHKGGTSPQSYKSQYIEGDTAIMSGYSQSFKFASNNQFGSNTIATPVAIRHVVMSSYSATTVPIGSGLKGEYEISIAERLKLDGRSIAFKTSDMGFGDPTIGHQARAWLEGVTNKPAPGGVIAMVKDAWAGKGSIPLPAIPAGLVKIGGKTGKEYEELSPDVGLEAVKVGLSAGYPGGDKDAAKSTLQEMGLVPGDMVEGLQGTRYVIVTDPGDSYGLRYVKLDSTTGKPNYAKSYPLADSYTKEFYRLDAKVKIPPPKAKVGFQAFSSEQYAQLANGEEKPIHQFAKGEIFKEDGVAYQIDVPSPSQSEKAVVLNLDTGEKFYVNPGHKSASQLKGVGFVEPTGDAGTQEMPGPFEPGKGQLVLVTKDGQQYAANYVGPVADPGGKVGDEVTGQALMELPVGTSFVVWQSNGAWGASKYEAVGGGQFKIEDGYAANIQPHLKAKITDAPDSGKLLVLLPGTQTEDVADPGALSPLKHKLPTTPQAGDIFSAQGVKLTVTTVLKNGTVKAKPSGGGKVVAFAPDDPALATLFRPGDFAVGPKQKAGQLAVGDLISGSPTKVRPYIVVEIVPGKVRLLDLESGQLSMTTKGKSWPTLVGKPAVEQDAPDSKAEAVQVAVKDLGVGQKFSLGGQEFEVASKEADGTGTAKNLATGTILPWHDHQLDKLVLPLSDKPSVETVTPQQPTTHEGLTKGGEVAVAFLKEGDHFTWGLPTIWRVKTPATGDQDAVTEELSPTTGKVIGSGTLAPGSVVTFWAKSDVKPSISPGTEADDLPMVGGDQLVPFKWHKGGKTVKNTKLKNLPTGTKFVDKNGKVWLVKEGGANPIVTDGVANYSGVAMADSWVKDESQVKGGVAFHDASPPLGNDGPGAAAKAIDDTLVVATLGTTLGDFQWSAWSAGEKFAAYGDVWSVTLAGAAALYAKSESSGTIKQFFFDFQPDKVEAGLSPKIKAAPGGAVAEAGSWVKLPAAAGLHAGKYGYVKESDLGYANVYTDANGSFLALLDLTNPVEQPEVVTAQALSTLAVGDRFVHPATGTTWEVMSTAEDKVYARAEGSVDPVGSSFSTPGDVTVIKVGDELSAVQTPDAAALPSVEQLEGDLLNLGQGDGQSVSATVLVMRFDTGWALKQQGQADKYYGDAGNAAYAALVAAGMKPASWDHEANAPPEPPTKNSVAQLEGDLLALGVNDTQVVAGGVAVHRVPNGWRLVTSPTDEGTFFAHAGNAAHAALVVAAKVFAASGVGVPTTFKLGGEPEDMAYWAGAVAGYTASHRSEKLKELSDADLDALIGHLAPLTGDYFSLYDQAVGEQALRTKGEGPAPSAPTTQAAKAPMTTQAAKDEGFYRVSGPKIKRDALAEFQLVLLPNGDIAYATQAGLGSGVKLFPLGEWGASTTKAKSFEPVVWNGPQMLDADLEDGGESTLADLPVGAGFSYGGSDYQVLGKSDEGIAAQWLNGPNKGKIAFSSTTDLMVTRRVLTPADVSDEVPLSAQYPVGSKVVVYGGEAFITSYDDSAQGKPMVGLKYTTGLSSTMLVADMASALGGHEQKEASPTDFDGPGPFPVMPAQFLRSGDQFTFGDAGVNTYVVMSDSDLPGDLLVAKNPISGAVWSGSLSNLGVVFGVKRVMTYAASAYPPVDYADLLPDASDTGGAGSVAAAAGVRVGDKISKGAGKMIFTVGAPPPGWGDDHVLVFYSDGTEGALTAADMEGMKPVPPDPPDLPLAKGGTIQTPSGVGKVLLVKPDEQGGPTVVRVNFSDDAKNFYAGELSQHHFPALGVYLSGNGALARARLKKMLPQTAAEGPGDEEKVRGQLAERTNLGLAALAAQLPFMGGNSKAKAVLGLWIADEIHKRTAAVPGDGGAAPFALGDSLANVKFTDVPIGTSYESFGDTYTVVSHDPQQIRAPLGDTSTVTSDTFGPAATVVGLPGDDQTQGPSAPAVPFDAIEFGHYFADGDGNIWQKGGGGGAVLKVKKSANQLAGVGEKTGGWLPASVTPVAAEDAKAQMADAPNPYDASEPQSSGPLDPYKWHKSGSAKHNKLGKLAVGQKFTDKAKNTYEVVGQTGGQALYRDADGNQFSAPAGAWVKALPVAQAAPGSDDIGVSYADAPVIPIVGFPSAWSSAGDYAYPPVAQFAIGQKFMTAEGLTYVVVQNQGGGKILVKAASGVVGKVLTQDTNVKVAQ